MTSQRSEGGQQARHRRSPSGAQTNRIQINDIHDRGAQARMGLLAGLLLLFVGLLVTLLYLVLS